MSENKQSVTFQQIEFFEIPSPCIGVCESNEKGFCKGCYRSREERLYWAKVNDATKRVILRACNRRRKRSLSPTTSTTVPPNSQGQLFSDNDT